MVYSALFRTESAIDTILWSIVVATVAGGALSLLVAASVTLTLVGPWVERLVGYAVGVLLGAAFLDLLPEAFSGEVGPEALFAVLLATVIAFFALEKLALWRHAHPHPDGSPAAHDDGASGALILLGDAVHNFVDGVLIAAAFLADPWVGVATTGAVVAHEIPQELGDFVVLLNAGFSRRSALAWNLLSSATSVAGGLLGYFLLGSAKAVVPYVLVVAAGSFIYVAIADLMPQLQRRWDAKAAVFQFGLMGAGVGSIEVMHRWLGH